MKRALLTLGLAAGACEAPSSSMDGSETSDSGDDGWRPEWPEFEVRYETEHIRVAPSFTAPVCQGSLDAMERHVVMVAAELEIEPGLATVFWFNDVVEGADLTEPHGDCFPCFKDGAVYSSWGSMMHEIVHAVVSPVLGRGDVTLGEGAAHAYNGALVKESAGDPLPSDLIGGTRQGGARFFRWLLNERGAAVIKDLFLAVPFGTGSAEGIAAFGEVLGQDVGDVEAEFLVAAPKVYAAPGLCDGLPEVGWEADGWSIDSVFDCAATNAFGPTDPGYYASDPDPYYFVAVVMNVPADVVGREFDVIRDPDLPNAVAVPCLEDPIDDLEVAKTHEFTGSESLTGWVLPHQVRYRMAVPVGPDGRATLRLQLK